MKHKLTMILILAASVSARLIAQAADPPKEGELCRLSGDTNQYVVVYVPPKEQVTLCIDTNAGKHYFVTNYDGPGFIGISPTNDRSRLVIVPWAKNNPVMNNGKIAVAVPTNRPEQH